MNFEIFEKVLRLPLSGSENSVAVSLAFHVPKDGDSCFPSYRTIHEESGVSDSVIKDSIEVLKAIGVIDYRHRGNIGTGKSSNEYKFIFKDINFYRSKGSRRISKEFTKVLKQRVKEARKQVKEERQARAEKHRSKRLPDNFCNEVSNNLQLEAHDNLHILGNRKSQNLQIEVRDTQGLEPPSITSDSEVITSDSGVEVDRDTENEYAEHWLEVTG